MTEVYDLKTDYSTNPINVVQATINGLKNMSTPTQVARKRGISLDKIWEKTNEES